MSRDSNGTYSLPAGNPVVTGTTITSSWANTTMSDLALALTDSLSRSGQGSMTAGLKLFAGTSSLPGLSWGAETTSGMYRNAAGDFRWVISTTELLRLTTNILQISGTAPIFRLYESDAAVDNRHWYWEVAGEQFRGRVANDALDDGRNFLEVERTGITINTVNFPNGTLQYAGIEVGYRGLPFRTFSASDNTLAADAGCSIYYSGTGGHTLTLDTDIPELGVVVLLNAGSGTLTIAPTGGHTLNWYNGSGTISTGNRTLTVGGIVTFTRVQTTQWNIWGTGVA